MNKDDLAWNILAAGFCSAQMLLGRLPAVESHEFSNKSGAFTPLDSAISAYLDGDTQSLDRLPVEQAGTVFQQDVWSALQSIKPGGTCTYAEIAKKIGRPGATRAVGSACGRNLIAPIVPCHRVVRSDGNLGGYLYGVSTKKWLLKHEHVDHDA